VRSSECGPSAKPSTNCSEGSRDAAFSLLLSVVLSPIVIKAAGW
jgi:hypothetical protein